MRNPGSPEPDHPQKPLQTVQTHFSFSGAAFPVQTSSKTPSFPPPLNYIGNSRKILYSAVCFTFILLFQSRRSSIAPGYAFYRTDRYRLLRACLIRYLEYNHSGKAAPVIHFEDFRAQVRTGPAPYTTFTIQIHHLGDSV